MKRIFYILALLGPGIISAIAGNDAGGTATYSIVGAHYGYQMLWILSLVAIALIIVQEMCARMGVVTGKGLSDLIREEFGLRITFLAMLVLLVANIAVTISEFAGIAASVEIFGISKYISIPIASLIIWWIIVKGSYRQVEKIFIGMCLVYLSYIFAGFFANPNWNDVLHHTFVPSFKWDKSFILITIAMIGTTVTPWMQFYLQSSVVEKGIRIKQYKYQRWDIILGSLIAVVIAFFIIIACGATLNREGIQIFVARDAALALTPIAGKFAGILFATGLFASSILGATILPLSSSYAICEAMGWENGINKKLKEAPIFFALYTLLILIGAVVILIPKIPLIPIMIFSQTTNGVLFPFILILMLLLVNNKRLMKKHTNSSIYNIIVYLTAISLIILSVSLLLPLGK